MWEAPSSPVQSVGQELIFSVASVYKVRPEWVNNLDSDDDGYPWDSEFARSLVGPGDPVIVTIGPKTTPTSPAATEAGYLRVIDMGADAGMGDGQINDDFPEVIRAVDYTRDYIRGIVGFIPPPGRLVLVTGRGDSMIPTIQPGESLLVDTGVQSYDIDGIYLVNLGNGQQIKRLRDHGEQEGI